MASASLRNSDSCGPWANRPGIKEPNDEDEILSAMLLLVPLLAISATAQARANDNSAPPPGVAVVAGYARLAIVVIGIAIIAQSSARFERTRRAIDRDEAIQIPQSRTQSLLSVALAIAVVIFYIHLAVL